MVIYLDTSALVQLYILEETSEEVHSLLIGQHEPLPVWEVQEMELTNALRLKVFWGEIEESEADHQIDLFRERKRRGLYYFPVIDRVELLRTFHDLTGWTSIVGCRTLDILHVACALHLSPDVFVSYDVRQRQLAEHTGLNLFPKSIPAD